MECNICHNVHRKFFCANCLRDGLRNHNAEMKQVNVEKQRYVDRATKFMNGSLRIQQLSSAEKHSATQKLNLLEFETERLREELGRDRQEVELLRKELQTRRQVLQESLAISKKFQSHQKTSIIKDIANTKERWRHVHTVLIHSRKVLIAELVSLFDFKKITINSDSERNSHKENGISINKKQPNSVDESITSNGTEGGGGGGNSTDEDVEYTIAGRALPRKGDFRACPQEEINTAVGHVIHMLGLIAHYLGVKLPFFMTRDKNSNPHAHGTLPGVQKSKRPLFLTDQNLEYFTYGMAMLNYNIAYLCHSQGVDIPFNKVPYTLQNLYLCCNSVNLGRYSHLTTLSASEQTFALDFEQLVGIMVARRYGDDTNPIIFRVPNALNDNYFYEEEDEEIEDGNETWDLVEMVV
ncbi:5754_t:CDS:2 [Ambispora gerdemannii]|uniref:Autophagy-related protein 14 n=1 Tax=Ambispora gerdemannii TaxID=144530 RepID=A0A9N9FUY2_9GLOM|nr:5754_t:CDS:2 [Ambispora gerdemannii]